MLKLFLRKLSSFSRLPVFIQAWLIPVWVILGISKILIWAIPFRVLARHLGAHAGIAALVPILTWETEVRATLIGRAIRLAALYTPWDSNCFPQAIAARVLLGLYGVPYAVYFGLKRKPESSSLDAHAWVCAGKVSVTGGASFEAFTVVGVFVSPELLLESDV
jgi:hypothetical protein